MILYIRRVYWYNRLLQYIRREWRAYAAMLLFAAISGSMPYKGV